MTAFTATTYQNEYLPIGGDRVHAIVTVVASGTGSQPAAGAGSAVMLILDASGSMQPRQKWRALRRAAEAAIDQITDGVHFGILAGSDKAEVVYPRSQGLMPASAQTRAEAINAVFGMRPAGGTAIGRWLMEARRRLAPYEGAIRHAILLTDGRDESESPQDLADSIRACERVFQCDCRGVGTDWRVDELRQISSALLGSVDIVPKPDDMAADFESMMRAAMGKRTADVRLRVWAPRGAKVDFVKQVSPTVEDLTERMAVIDDRTVELATGAWGDESRDYHVAITVPPQEIGAEMLAGRVSLVVDGLATSQSSIKAIWTDDTAASTRINPRVAHYTGQVELASAIADGLEAQARGDTGTATVRFGRAAQLAASSGNDDTLRLLARVVDLVDAPTGTVRLRREVSAADAMTLDTRSTRTVRVRDER